MSRGRFDCSQFIMIPCRMCHTIPSCWSCRMLEQLYLGETSSSEASELMAPEGLPAADENQRTSYSCYSLLDSPSLAIDAARQWTLAAMQGLLTRQKQCSKESPGNQNWPATVICIVICSYLAVTKGGTAPRLKICKCIVTSYSRGALKIYLSSRISCWAWYARPVWAWYK